MFTYDKFDNDNCFEPVNSSVSFKSKKAKEDVKRQRRAARDRKRSGY